MKKILNILLTFILTFSLLVKPSLALQSNESFQDLNAILNKVATKEEVEEVGQKIADEKNKMNQLKTGGELWTVVSSEQLYGRRAIKGQYKTHIDSYTDQTHTVTVNLGATFTYNPSSSQKISVNGGISNSKSKTFHVPKGEKLPNGSLATHRLFIGITFGEIYKYTYRITDKYTGNYIRTETVNSVVGAEIYGLTQLMAVNSNGSITVANIDNNKVKTYSSLSAYKNALQQYSYKCKEVIYF